jgi:hypothetical protein
MQIFVEKSIASGDFVPRDVGETTKITMML